MLLPGDIDEDKLAGALNSLHDLCVICEAAPTMHDVLGFPWCDEHRVRGEFIDYGAAHNWPALEAGVYSLAQGAWYWVQTALLYIEECVLALFVEAIGQEEPKTYERMVLGA